MNAAHRYLNIYYMFLVFAIPLVFLQKSEQAYYLPKMVLLVSALQFYVPFFMSLGRIKTDFADKALFVFLCFYALGFTNAPFLKNAFVYYAEWAAAAGMFYYGRYFLSAKDAKKIVVLVLLSASIAGVYGIMQAFGWDLSGWTTDFSGRAFSTFGNPDFLGGFLLLVVPVSLAVYFSFRRMFLSVFLFVFLAGVLLFSQTRSSIAAFGAGLCVLCALLPGYFKKTYKYIVPGIALVFVLVIASGRHTDMGGRIASIGDVREKAVQGRYEMWQAGLKMAGDNLFTGRGIYSVKSLYYRYKVSDGYSVTDRLHNDYIEIMVESGIMALLFFFVFAGAVVFKLFLSGTYFSRMVIAAFVGFFIHAFFNFPFYLVSSKAYFFVIAGLALRAKQEVSIQRGNDGLKAGLAGVAVSIFVIVLLCGSIYLNYGINLLNASKYDEARYYLERASDFDMTPEAYYHLSGYYLEKKEEKKAAEKIYAYLQRFPSSKKGNIRAAVIMSETGNNKRALDYLDGFLRYYPKDTDVMNNRGKVLYLQSRMKEAVDEYKRVIELDPLNAVAYYNLYGIYN
ncbi:MAG TPA: tetratricopeptide repeat protein, partial [Firmicutes bacterium]|nr:tetratricopeptide repeat protein [Bacillota bacterium]